MSNDLISRSETERLLRAYADEVGCNRGDYELYLPLIMWTRLWSS